MSIDFPGGGSSSGVSTLISKTEALPYSLIAADLGKIIYLTGTGTVTLSNGLKDGFNAVLVDDDALGGKILSSPNTLNAPGGTTGNVTISSQNTHIAVEMKASNVWYFSGNAS